jgi:hypothetical protein
MLIPSLYATSPRTRSLRPVRVPSDQNTRRRLRFLLSTNKRQEFFVSTHLPHFYTLNTFWGWMFSPRRRTRATTSIKKFLSNMGYQAWASNMDQGMSALMTSSMPSHVAPHMTTPIHPLSNPVYRPRPQPPSTDPTLWWSALFWFVSTTTPITTFMI